MSGKRYSDKFKKQIVDLRNKGKPLTEIIKEYGMTRTSVYNWTKNIIQQDHSNQKITNLMSQRNLTACKNKMLS